MDLLTCHDRAVTPWLPLISSLVIASVTFFGILLNNKANRRAIEAAEIREYDKWRREAILEETASILGLCLKVRQKLEDEYGWLTLEDGSYDFATEMLSALRQTFEDAESFKKRIEILAHGSLSEACNDLIKQLGGALYMTSALLLLRSGREITGFDRYLVNQAIGIPLVEEYRREATSRVSKKLDDLVSKSRASEQSLVDATRKELGIPSRMR